MNLQFFKDNSYVTIKKFVGNEVANFLYHHMLFNEKRFIWLCDNKENYSFLKSWKPSLQSPYGYIRSGSSSCFSIYGDSVFEGLLYSYTKKIGEYVGLELIPTYSFSSVYRNGDELTPHTDRSACEISVTFCLGYSNNEPWPIYLGKEISKPLSQYETIPIFLYPGDIMIYRGIQIPHWRNPLDGDHHAQLFLHYNDKNGPYKEKNLFDERPFVGLPSVQGSV